MQDPAWRLPSLPAACSLVLVLTGSSV